LKLTHSDLESFPIDEPGLKKENFIAGWKMIIGKNLKVFLESEKNERQS